MTQTYPLLPLRDIVVFPGMVVPLFVGRDKSVAALEAAMEASKDIVLIAQLDPGCDDPEADDLYDVGVVATVLQLLKLPDGTVRVLVEGKSRARLSALEDVDTHLLAAVGIRTRIRPMERAAFLGQWREKKIRWIMQAGAGGLCGGADRDYIDICGGWLWRGSV